jgi:hypothetical protein
VEKYTSINPLFSLLSSESTTTSKTAVETFERISSSEETELSISDDESGSINVSLIQFILVDKCDLFF